MAPPLKAPVGALIVPKKTRPSKLIEWAGVKVQTAPMSGNHKEDVLYVQTLLISWTEKWNACASDKVPTFFDRPKKLNGSINSDYRTSSTVKAIKSFQSKVLQRKDPGGIVYPGGHSIIALEAIHRSTGFEKLTTSGAKMVHSVFHFIARFGPVQINGGKRTVQRQAELMAQMTPSTLRRLYGAASSYVPLIIALPMVGKSRNVEEVLKIIKAARNEDSEGNHRGSFVSHHIGEDAVDIQITQGFDIIKAEKVAKELHLKTKDERPDIHCFHVNF